MSAISRGLAEGMYHAELIAAPSVRGRWAALARAAWIAVASLSVVLLVVSVAAYYRQALALSAPALRNPDAHGMGSPETVRAALQALGLSVQFYAAYSSALLLLFGLVFAGVGLAIFLHRPNERMALIVSLWLVTFGATFTPATWSIQSVSPALYAVGDAVGNVAYAGLFLMFYVFPDGRFVPRWTRWLALLFVWVFLLASVFPGTPLDPESWGVVNLFLLIFLAVSMLFAQVYRYLRVSTPPERQQTKWATFGLLNAVAGFFLFFGIVPSLFPALNKPGPTGFLYDIVSSSLVVVGFMLIPISIGLAVLRHRLWEIDVIINRALVYGGLTVGVVGVSALIVGGLAVLLEARGNWLLSLFAAGLIAVVFAPVRDRLQCAVNRLTYGDRDDPYRVISRLGARLESALAPDAVLPMIVQTVREALKLPYAAVAVARDSELIVAAEAG